MTALVGPHVLPDDDREEIRFALALNGGVSLAVWMGGVVHEIDRIRRGEGAYGQLAEITQSTARVDVVAGASAGGLNGALLALAVACNTNLEGVRDLWLAKGSFAELLRDPFERDPPSLLRGDDYFLPTVRSAFEAVYARRREDPNPEPLDLIVTTTLLTGDMRAFPDAYGALVPDTDHRARFEFQRDPDAEIDDFASAEAPARLALAARSSSSFPAAFEASYVPIGSGSGDRPDMAGIASFEVDRYAIDGGVLVNMPLGPMVRAILRKPARRQIRRVAAVVVPTPGAFEPPKPDEQDKVPEILDIALASVSALPRKQSIGEYLEQVEENNRRSLEWRDRRDELLSSLTASSLADLAQQLGQAYLRVRRAEAARYITRRVVEGVTPLAAAAAEAPLLNQEAIENAVASASNPPWLPIPEQIEPFTTTGEPMPGGAWIWGIAPLERFTSVLLDLVRHSLLLVPVEEANARETLRDIREAAHLGLRQLRAARETDRRFWESRAQTALTAQVEGPSELGTWIKASSALWREEVPDSVLVGVATALGDLLLIVAGLVRELAPTVEKLRSVARKLDTLAPPGATSTDVLGNLVRLEFVERTLIPDVSAVHQFIELFQISGNAPNAFDGRARAEEKLAGIQLAHFGAFYKSSWRANDWLWGRLDGISQLVRVLLHPRRLRQLYSDGAPDERLDRVVGLVRQVVLEGADASATPVLERYWDEAAIRAELEFIRDQSIPPPKGLPASTLAIVRRLQLEVLRAELPVLARCVREDVADGGEHVPARHWAARVGVAEKLEAPKALELFTANEVGRETIFEEVGTDLFTRTATKIFATASTAAKGPHSGLVGPLRKAATVVRGVAMATYLLARGAVGRSKTGSALLAFVLATAGAILAIQLLADADVWAPLTTLAIVVLIGGFLLALVRSGKFAVFLIAAAIAAAAVGTLLLVDEDVPWWKRPFVWLDDAGALVIAVAAIVGVAMLFGVMRRPKWSYRVDEIKREAVGRLLLFVSRYPVVWVASRLPPWRKARWYVKTDQPAVALTIDDGPDGLVTPALLDVLAKHGARATFFLLGKGAHGQEALVSAILAGGHEIASHGWKDERASSLSRATFAQSLRDTHDVLTEVDAVTLYRPGGGRLGQGGWVADEAERLHDYETVLASVYPQDLRIASEEKIVDYLVSQARKGAVLVVHDGDPKRLRVARIVDEALTGIEARGFSIVTVSELVALETG